ncbi:putative mitochondrial folate/biopterin transporter [Leptomonas pyrrhocoris]|uniref:Putative mitochondrial folate/biopterin transporter n=1 Tax=Leptomonas pyrrhocoris TaxID=157538 RepID=A0A0N0DTD8_LEPPY|nr:putative mitochondrial folate/biopterin transporter [Leptomonas pyrrhocoris]KPA77362.1 putative mitochondrial folate/biopterin transporter [Leptomonas pyrrhocoris]|eukprot:XP_015655801.1 putative mitochondrial folate/biopterin transporter [Leptomonas pyrrhocoris]
MSRPLQELTSIPPSRRPSEIDRPDGSGGDTDDYIHPDAVALFNKAPWARKIPVFGMSCEGYGPKCTVALSLVYFLNKGFGNNLITISRYAMFVNRFGLTGTRYQRLSSIASMSTSVKAITAVLSDTFALCGYTKRWACGGSCVVGAAFTLAFGLLPATVASGNSGAGFLFLAKFCISNVDILSEGHYSRLMRRHPKSGPALVSWIWWFILVASLVAACVQGPLSDMQKPQVGLFISAAVQVVCVVFFVFNWYGERPNRVERAIDRRVKLRELNGSSPHSGEDLLAPGDGIEGRKKLNPENDSDREPAALHDEIVQGDCVLVPDDAVPEDELNDDDMDPEVVSLCCGAVEVNTGVARRNWRIIVYSAIMTCAVVALACVTILGSTWDLLWTSIAVCVVATVVSFLFLPMMIAKANTYFYIHMTLYLQFSGAMDSFYMAKKECYPDGPHFTFTFYNTIASVIGNIAGIAGVTAFAYIFSNQGYRFTLIVTILIQIVASIFDIIIVERWNLYIGIPDHAMYIMGDAIVYEVCYYLAWMPMVLLLSRVCPRGSESMIYALVASSGNLGSGMASTIGSILLEKAWPIVTKGAGKCDFRNLTMLLLVGHFCLPLLIIPISFLLIPSARVCDDIDVDGHVIQKGSKPHEPSSASTEGAPDSMAEAVVTGRPSAREDSQ